MGPMTQSACLQNGNTVAAKRVKLDSTSEGFGAHYLAKWEELS